MHSHLYNHAAKQSVNRLYEKLSDLKEDMVLTIIYANYNINIIVHITFN